MCGFSLDFYSEVGLLIFLFYFRGVCLRRDRYIDIYPSFIHVVELYDVTVTSPGGQWRLLRLPDVQRPIGKSHLPVRLYLRYSQDQQPDSAFSPGRRFGTVFQGALG